MAKLNGSQRIKQRTLALVFAAALVVCISGSTQAIPAPVNIPINSVSYGTLGSFDVVKANLTNDWASSMDLVVFAVWKNTAGQTVAISTGGLTLASAATGTTFCPLMDELPRGSYIVAVFAVTTNNNPVSIEVSLSVAI